MCSADSGVASADWWLASDPAWGGAPSDRPVRATSRVTRLETGPLAWRPANSTMEHRSAEVLEVSGNGGRWSVWMGRLVPKEESGPGWWGPFIL